MRLLTLLVVALAGACTHVVTIESTPPGATVLVEDRVVGTTPCTLQEQSGRDDLVTVEVQRDHRAARFAYRKAGISVDAATAAGAGACGMCALGVAGIGSLFVALPLLFVTGAVPAAAPLIFCGGYSAYIVGLMLVSFAPQAFVLGVAEGARQGPDRIHVDLTGPTPTVQGQPGEMIVPLVGRRAPGARAIPGPDPPAAALARCVGKGGA